ncbi:MAG TPA: DUF485 domain-containing protein [Gemmatimonadaceae bacterium]|jgi:uncharacterized membrane protein (DUF485 family)
MPASSSLAPDERLRVLAAQRWRIALTLTAVMIVLYFGFIVLIAYGRSVLAILLAPGLTVGILLGALVIVISWLLTYGYVRWANTRYDVALRELSKTATDAGVIR